VFTVRATALYRFNRHAYSSFQILSKIFLYKDANQGFELGLEKTPKLRKVKNKVFSVDFPRQL